MWNFHGTFITELPTKHPTDLLYKLVKWDCLKISI